MLTPHKKRKKCKNKFYTLPHETHTAEEETSRWSKKEKRKKRKEGRRKDLVVAGSRRKDLVVALRHLAADPLATKTHDWVSPAVGLVFFFFPSGLIFFGC
jgi:hypothetical protein